MVCIKKLKSNDFNHVFKNLFVTCIYYNFDLCIYRLIREMQDYRLDGRLLFLVISIHGGKKPEAC